MPTELDNFIDRSNSLYNEFKQNAISILRSEINILFTKYPNLKGIRWEQWTPSFNDGDACLFGINSFRVDLGEKNIPFYSSAYDIDDPDLYDDIEKFRGKLDNILDFLNDTFGEAMITVTSGSQMTLEVERVENHD